MLKADDPGFCRLLIDEGRQATKAHLAGAVEAVEKYHGGFWVDPNGREVESTPENTYFEYVTAMLPRLVFHNPRVRVASRRSGPQADVATAIRHGLNRLVKDARLNLTLRDVALDMMFAYGVVLVKESPRDGLSLTKDDPMQPAKPTWPVAERVSPRLFFMDPAAHEWSSTRYRGHEWRIDKDDLIKRAKENSDEGWNLEMIEELAVDVEDDLGLASENRPEKNLPRREVCAYDIWFPEITLPDSPGPDEGFFGTIYTLAISQAGSPTPIYDNYGEEVQTGPKQGFIRDPRPFYGPRTGPYSLFGVYKVPDSPYPLSPIMAVEQQVRELNTFARVNAKNLQSYKRVIGVRDRQTAEKIKNAPHDHVIALDGDDLRQSLVQAEFAGISEHSTMYEDRLMQRVRRLLGIDETMTGNTTGDATATEHTLASESSQARISEIKAGFDRGAVDVLSSEAHYLYYSETTIFPVSDEVFQDEDTKRKVPEFLQKQVEPWFRGGDPDRENGYTFEDLELDIEPYSMERTSEGMQMQRMMQAHEIMMGVLPAMQQFPDFPWKDWLKKLGDAMNLPGMDELIKPEMLKRLAEQLEAMTQAQAQPQMAAQQGAHFGGQVGVSRSQASQGQGPPTAARTQGQGMPGQKSGGMMQAGKPAKIGA